MSNQWYYNCDGRTGGPVSQVQLQLMVNSGLLLPHHQVRRGDQPAWSPARSVRGLFPVPTAAPVGDVPQALPAEEDPPFGFGQAEPAADAPPAGVFDFFAEAAPPAPPPPPPAPPPKAAAKPAKPARKPPELPPPPVESTPPMLDAALTAGSPFAFEAESAPESAPAEAAAEPKPAPAAVAEVSGVPVELLRGDTLRLLDGKTTFRLHRAWLLAVTKYPGGTGRTVYLRLQRLDGVTVEPLFEAGPGRKGPHPVLCFHAGDLRVALAFQGSDKPYRAFAEKVLQQSNASNKHVPHAKE